MIILLEFNPPIQLEKYNYTCQFNSGKKFRIFITACDALLKFVILLLIANLDSNCFFFFLIPLSLHISTPKGLKIIRKQTLQIISAQHNFDDIFQFSHKSILIDRKWDQNLPLVDSGRVMLIKRRNFAFQMAKTPMKFNSRPNRASHFDHSSDNEERFFSAFSEIVKLLNS